MKIVNDKVVGHRGDVLAQKIRGKWESKDPAALAFALESEKPVKKKKAPVEEASEE
jgi:hypothetical protein